MCNACLFLANIWSVYDLVSLIITFTDIYFHSFEFLCMEPMNAIQNSCKWIALLHLNEFFFLHMFIVHGCSILINFYSRIMSIGLNMRIKAIHFLVPLNQRGALCLQSGSRRRYIVHFIYLL
jgi:hypothetical protein